MVAPGGGTQADVNHLSRQLGMRSDAVHAILNCEGAGVEAVRSSRRRGGAANTPANTTPAATTKSTAWADFMSEEGFGQPEPEPPLGKRPRKSSAKKASTTATNTSDGNGVVEREYVLPIKAKIRLDDTEDKEGTVEEGILAQTGSLDATMPGRSNRPLTLEKVDLQAPTLLMYESVFGKKSIGLIATSSSSCHSLALDKAGNAYAWGRNECGQCGTGTISDCVPYPTRIGGDFQYHGAATGKSHSILLSTNGMAYAAGSNKMGQCGVNHKIETIVNFRKCFIAGSSDTNIVLPVQASCGEYFSVLLTDKGHLYSSGLSQYGQLGNGETGEHFIQANKIAFANATKFERRSVFVQAEDPNNDNCKDMIPLLDSSSIVIGNITCGKSHTLAVEASSNHTPRVFSWGCGDYGCLGHNVQADEYLPRLITTLTGPAFHSNFPTRAAAGKSCSMILTKNGHVYYWGRHRAVGEATMRPALIDALANNQHQVTTLSAGFQTVFCSTSNGVTVSWGNGPYGELGFGKDNNKSSSKPKFVEALDKVLVTDVQCGYAHTLFLLRHQDQEDKSAIQRLTSVETNQLTEFTQVLQNSKKPSTTTIVVEESTKPKKRTKKSK